MKGEIVPFSLWNPDKHRGFQGIDEGEGVSRDSFFKNTDSGKMPTYSTFVLFKEQITQKGK